MLPQVVVGLRVIRVDVQGSSVTRDRRFRLPLRIEHNAQVVVRFHIVRPESKRPDGNS